MGGMPCCVSEWEAGRHARLAPCSSTPPSPLELALSSSRTSDWSPQPPSGNGTSGLYSLHKQQATSRRAQHSTSCQCCAHLTVTATTDYMRGCPTVMVKHADGLRCRLLCGNLVILQGVLSSLSTGQGNHTSSRVRAITARLGCPGHTVPDYSIWKGNSQPRRSVRSRREAQSAHVTATPQVSLPPPLWRLCLNPHSPSRFFART